MVEQVIPDLQGYSGMGHGRTDYEACYEFTPRMLYWGSHCHDFYELYIHYHGGQKYSCDGRLYDLVPNQLIVVPPFSMHGLVCLTEARDYERAFLYCSSETLRQLGFGQIDLDAAFRAGIREKGHAYQLSEADGRMCRDLLIRIKAQQDLHTPETDFENFGLLMTLLNCLLKAVRNQKSSAERQAPPDLIQQIVEYIDAHYAEPIGLETIAAHFSISKSALSHEFARYTNRGVYDYILYRRVTLARQLIPYGQPLGDVAQSCGFCDYSNFLRIFHKHTGMSPSQYRVARLNAMQCGKEHTEALG